MPPTKEKELKSFVILDDFKITPKQLIDGRNLRRKTVGSDKVVSIGALDADTVDTASIQALAVTTAKLAAAAVTSGKLSYEQVTVTVAAGQPSGTGTATSGSIIIGYRPAGNCDQLVDNVAISGTTVTVTLAANATAQCDFVVILIKSA